MSLTDNYQLMASYNQWMNENIYRVAAELSESELAENRGAFFRSITGTLNHILVGDTIWLKRFAGHPSQPVSLDPVRKLAQPESLDSIPFPQFESLKKARFEMDGIIQDFAAELTEKALQTPLTYTNTRGVTLTRNFAHLLQHFFNHQTHHRGQVTTLLNQAGLQVGETDLLACIPDR